MEEMKKGKKRQLGEKMNEIEVGQLDRDIAKADLQIEKLKMEKEELEEDQEEMQTKKKANQPEPKPIRPMEPPAGMPQLAVIDSANFQIHKLPTQPIRFK